ncbi:MAG: DUF2971 domain-containing protein [Polaromonas sp.]|nr:DUF2971 domain-containing protein [Polaromonas sp.]
MPQPPKPGARKYLRRYTHLPAAIELLKTNSLTLLDPSSWDDGNDTFYVSEYKRRMQLKSTLAVCLSGAEESYHYWKVFAGHPAGVCIRLRQGMLLKSLRGKAGITVGEMDYRLMTAARKKALTLEEFPFVKRRAYIDEKEVRVLWESKTEERSSFNVPIPFGCIARITLSPWLPKSLVNSTKSMLRSIDGCSRLEVVRSTIIASEEWKNIARHAA